MIYKSNRIRIFLFQSRLVKFYFPQHAFHPVIMRKADVAESMRQNPRIDTDSATPGKPSVQNIMIGCCSGLVINRHEHDDLNLTLLTGTSPQGGGFPSLFEKVDFGTSCRMIRG